MRHTGLDGVLATLHAGVFEHPPWSTFLDRLREITGADYVSLIFRQADTRLPEKIMSSGRAGKFEPEYLEALMTRAKLPYGKLAANRPYALPEIVDSRNSSHAEYLAYLHGRNIHFCFVIRITEPGGGNGSLSLSRSKSDFAPDIRKFLSRLAPQISLAVRTLATLERERLRADIAADAVRRLNFGWVSFDLKGAVVDLDDTAAHLFRDVKSLGAAARGRLFPLKGQARRALLDTLSAFCVSSNSRPRAVHLSDEPWLDMLVVPVSSSAVASGVLPVAVGYVHGVDAASAERCEQLKQLFSLTHNEARLAIALTQGKSIAEAAVELNLTEGSARIYSKRIYSKTATRGQADLVRVILASVIALA
jgi:DNA-binding CsgD family transcriptional regulator